MPDTGFISGKRWVNVAFPLPRTPVLSYQYIEGEPLAAVGSLVVAPIGSRKATGVVVEYPQSVAIETKPISTIMHSDAVISDELVALMQVCTKKYAAPAGDVLQTMILKGLCQNTKRKIIPSNQQGKPLTPVEQDLFDHLIKSGQWDYQYFVRNRKKDMPVLKALLKKGWVLTSDAVKPNQPQAKTETFYKIDKVDLEKKYGKRQKEIIQELQVSGGWVSKSFLKQKYGNITGSINKLMGQGVLESKSEIQNTKIQKIQEHKEAVDLTKDQADALDYIKSCMDQSQEKEILLHGVTGSGKTEVYLRATQACLAKGKKVLALVPEISLTPQFVNRFIERFGHEVALLHSKRTDAERLTEWHRILQKKVNIVVGTRSAVFAPIDNIGLIILDESHDHSYKQHDGIRYHARDIAKLRSKHHKCPLLLGSATPSIESYFGIKDKVTLPERVTGHSLPNVEIFDLKKEQETDKKKWIGDKLQKEIQHTLTKNKQVLLFLNRRGYSNIVYCYKCGKEVHCPHCAVTMTFHKEKKTAQCHYCFYMHDFEEPCPSCFEGKLVHFGIGTQKLEEELNFLFPDANIARLDRDQTQKKNIFTKTMKQMIKGDIDILIGTQMITKGLDIPNIELVGILLADQSLHFPDFRAAETTFQLITQVVGRSGRGENKGKAFIQTLQPNHYAIKYGAAQDYEGFYNQEIALREAMTFPPYAHLALFEAVGRSPSEIQEMLKWLYQQVANQANIEIEMLGPAPAPISKVRDDFRFHLLLKSKNKETLESTAQWLFKQARPLFEKRKMKLKMDLHPLSFL